MKKMTAALLIGAMIMTLALPVHAAIYPDPGEVSDALEREQKADEEAAKNPQQPTSGNNAQNSSQSRQQQQPSQTPNNNPVTITPKVKEETKEEKEDTKQDDKDEKQKAEEKTQLKTDFSQILSDGLTAQAQEDLIRILREKDILSIKMSETGETVLSSQTSSLIRPLDKTLVITVYDYTDKPYYQYEVQTKDLPHEDWDVKAAHDMTEGEKASVRYTLSGKVKGKFRVWLEENADYDVEQGPDKTVVKSDSNGAVTIDITDKTIALAPKEAEGNKGLFWIMIGALVGVIAIGGMFIKSFLKAKKAKAPVKQEEDFEDPDEEDEDHEDIDDEEESYEDPGEEENQYDDSIDTLYDQYKNDYEKKTR